MEMVEVAHDTLRPATLELEQAHHPLTPAVLFVEIARKRAERPAMTEILQTQMDAHRHALLKQGLLEQAEQALQLIHARKYAEMEK